MEQTEYETKQVVATPKKPAKKEFVVISPRGHQYVVKKDDMNNFKKVHDTTSEWEIK